MLSKQEHLALPPSFRRKPESSSFDYAQHLNSAFGAQYALDSSIRWNDGDTLAQRTPPQLYGMLSL